MEIERLEVKENDVNKRLDVFISENLEGKSRSYVQGLIEKEKVKVNEKLKKSNYKLKLDDLVTVEVPEVTALEVEKEDIPLDILYEDDDIIVIKQASRHGSTPSTRKLQRYIGECIIISL